MLHSLTVPAWRNALTALSGQLAKALTWGESNGVGELQLLAARLAPDMFPLATQIRFSCGQALQAATRLGASGAPDFADEARMSVVCGMSVSVRVDLSGAIIINIKKLFITFAY